MLLGNQIEFRHLKYFLAVAEELHFRKAAERLYISQPGLSRQIKQLEDSLGVILFERHNRKVALTQAGSYLKDEITIHFKQLNEIFTHAQLLNDGKKGQLKIGYVGSAMQQIIPELLLKSKQNNPDVVFSLTEMDNQKQLEDLLHFNIDIGFVRLDRVPVAIEIKPVLRDTFCLVLPENHPIDTKNFSNLSQFKDESFILFDPTYSKSYYEKVMQIFDDSNFSPNVSHLTIHSSSIFKLVEHHFGISIIPKSLISTAIKGVKFIELTKITQRTDLSVIWNKTNRNPILISMLDLINEMSKLVHLK